MSHFQFMIYLWKNGTWKEVQGFYVLTTVWIINSFLFFLDRIFFNIPDPKTFDIAFIVAHPRSGTTNFQDSVNLCGATYLDLIFPSLVSKKLCEMFGLKKRIDKLLSKFDTPGHRIHSTEYAEVSSCNRHSIICFQHEFEHRTKK